MTDDKKDTKLNEGYIPKLVTIIDDSNSKFGYQPSKSSGNNLSNVAPPTSIPPRKP